MTESEFPDDRNRPTNESELLARRDVFALANIAVGDRRR
jgi:hypothetical protein